MGGSDANQAVSFDFEVLVSADVECETVGVDGGCNWVQGVDISVIPGERSIESGLEGQIFGGIDAERIRESVSIISSSDGGSNITSDG